ncbi:MAG: hypothetical protein ACRDL2_05935 [Gaiellaceae bacterium]
MRRFLGVTGFVCVLGFGVLAGPALADTTIGTTSGTLVGCSGPFTAFQAALATAGVTYTVPAGSWTITSWSTRTDGAAGQMMGLVVGRPTGTADQYTIVGESAVQTLTANTLNTFPVSITVQGGDVIGYYIPGSTDCAFSTGNGGDSLDLGTGGEPAVGSTFDTPDRNAGYILDLSVTLAPTGTVEQVNHVFLCYSKFEQDGGASFDVDQQDALLKTGYWTPDAVAGNVTGADNIGAYHLMCNPPSGVAQTSQLLDGGGNVIPASVVGSATDGYYPILG